MDNSLIDSRNPVFGHPVPGSVMASRSRAGVLVDPMPLPGQPAPLKTDISQDLLEQRGTQEQAKLRERFQLLQQWQQQQQNQLMLQQQQQLELLRNQQEVVQQALMQQRLKQWGGMKVTNSPPKSPSHKRSPKKSPTPSPTRGTKVPSSIPKALAQAAMTQPVSNQNGRLPAMENLDPATKRCGSSTLQEDAGLDSESEHHGSLMLEGVYPLPDTASETSDAGNDDDDHHDDLFEGRSKDAESRDDEIFRSVSDFSMTPTSGSPRDIHHLSIHLPDTGRTGASPPPQSPDHYPASTISPQLSPFTPTTPSRQGGNRSTLDGEEEEDGGEGRGKEERPIQSQLGAEFKSFEELVELQIKADDRMLPTAGSTTSEQTTGRPRHTFLKRGEGISRFGMKLRKLKPRKDKPARPTQSGVGAKKPKSDGSRVGSKAESMGGKQRENVGKKRQPKKDEPPKISRKVSGKPQLQSQPGVKAPENIFKKPHPAPTQKPNAIKPVMSPVEREKVGVAPLQHCLMVPSLDLPGSSQSELDDTIEVSFMRRAKMWEKETKIEQEDLDEFEMLEEAADDNVSFCSEASLVISVLQRAQRRKQELLGVSPLKKKAPLATLESVDATEEKNYELHDRSPDQSHDPTQMNEGYTENEHIASDKRNGYYEQQQTHDQRGTKVTDGKPSLAVHRETVPRGRLTLSEGHTAEIRDDFYSSEGESDEETGKDVDDAGVGRSVMRKVSKRSSEKGFMMEYQLDLHQDEDQSGRIEGKEDNKHLGRLHDSDDEEEEEEEEEDFDIYRTGRNENTNNNSNTNVRHEMLLTQNRITSSQSVRTSSSTRAESSHPIENGDIHNGHSVGKHNISDEFEEDFEGTPRKTVASPEVADQVEFGDEETWGDFTAQLSDSSDEDSIVAMAPYLKSTPAKDEGKVGMKRKKSEKTASEEVLLSPPPTSALVAKLFPKLRQPDVKQKQQIEHEEKALHAKAERPAGEGSQARLLRDRLTQLENEIERFRKENLLLAKLREEREKGLESMKKEIEEFQKQKAEELQRIQEYKDEETKKLKRERKMFEKHQKTLRTMPDKRDREEIEMLKHQLGDLQTELKQRESRWNASTRRLKDRTVALETENTELREEVRLMEQRRLAAWKKEENNKGKPIYATPSSIPKPSPPARHENQTMEQSNNNNINKKRPGSEDRPIIRNGDNQHHRGSAKSRTMSESSDDDESDNEYLQAYPAPRMEPSKQDDDIIYESQIALRRSRSPSDRERLPIPVPNERTPPPARTKPSSLSPSSTSSIQPTPLTKSPQHLPQPRPRGSPHRDMQNGHGYNHGVAGKGVVSIHQDGGDEDEDYEDVLHGDGKVEQVNPDGSRVLTFSNGTRKEISADGQTIIISFFNGDVKQILPDQRVVYYYSETKTTHTTYQDGLEILQFSNNQTEKHYPDGTKEITFPDQTIKYLFPNGGEESVFADGTVLRVDPNGHRVMEFPNGQREIHTDQYKRREYPDGTMKTVYPDGRQETRYSSGRIRIKDKTGNIVVDRKG